MKKAKKTTKEKKAFKYFQRLSEKKQAPEDDFHIINESGELGPHNLIDP